MHRTIRHLVPLTFLLTLLVAPGPPAGAQTSRNVSDELLIRYRPAVDAAGRTAVRSAGRAQRLRAYEFIDLDLVRVAGNVEDVMRAIRADPRVLYVERNVLWSVSDLPDDPLLSKQWSLQNTGQTGGVAGADISAGPGWSMYTGDPDLLIGVVDTGIDLGHVDLVDNLWTNPGEIPGNGLDDDRNGWVDDVHGYDFANLDDDPSDDHGHGTHVAGIIAARANNGTGTAGVAWRGKLVALKFLNSQGVGPTSDAILAIEYALANGIRLTNHSWGGLVYSQALYDALAEANTAGHLAVAAAGNRALDIDTQPFYPASYDLPNILSVAATTDGDALAGFSNYGSQSVDIAAPGELIFSTMRGDSYGLLSGTSMAAPHVAGAAALVLGRFPSLTPTQISSLLMSRADAVPALQGKVLSGGRLNLLRALIDSDSIPPGRVHDLALQDAGSNSARISWTATGDDGATGLPFGYDVFFATFPIDSSNVHLTGRFEVRAQHAPGQPETLTVHGLEVLRTYYFAVRAVDDFNNVGPLSDWVVASTLGAPGAELDPPGFAVDLFTGQSAERVLTLGNVREGTLDFTIDDPRFLFPESREALSIRRTAQPTSAGGPDAFGYRWDDSREPDGPSFDWVDLAGAGTALALQGDDVTSAEVDIGFRFPFYGSSFDSLRICTNGWLSFSSSRAHYVNLPLPLPDAPMNLVAPFWDDLAFGIERKVTTWTDGSRFVATWTDVPSHSGGGPYTFQVILYATGEIRFQYLSMPAPATSATIGLQDATGTRGLLVVYNDSFVEDSLAVRLAPLPNWARTDIVAGRVRMGEVLQIPVQFDATGLLAGAYAGSLVVHSNDPGRPRIAIALDMRVAGAPDVRVEPAALILGEVFVGTEATSVLRVRNAGTDDLHVSSLASDHADVHVAGGGFDLSANTFRDLAVRYAPESNTVLTASISVHSDDADAPQWVVPVVATPLEPPLFDVSTNPLHAALSLSRDTVQTLRVWNRGGTALSLAARASLAGERPPGLHPQWAGVFTPTAKGGADPGGSVSGLAAGGPDAFGYGWRDSHAPGGPQFEWLDVRGLGSLLPIVGDDVTSTAVDLGFSFPFYGEIFDQVRVCTNGWLSFTSSINAFANTPLPIAIDGVPENLLAVMWDDLHLGAAPHVWVWSDGVRFVVQFQEVARFGEGAAQNTFQVILHVDGRIRYQYLTMKAQNLRSATIGIQNGSRDDGLLVAFNAPYLHDSLVVEFSPPAGWLRIAPEQAQIAPGEWLDFDVTFDAAGRLGGTYVGRLEFVSNDPWRIGEFVPAELEVTGVPHAVVVPAALQFGVAYTGNAKAMNLGVVNPGTDTLHVTHVESSDPAFTTGAVPFAVPPLGRTQLVVTLDAAAPGAVSAELTLTTNAPGAATLRVPLLAEVRHPPAADIMAPNLEAALAATLGSRAASDVQYVVIHNAGQSTLEFEAVTHAPVAPAGPRHAPAVEATKGTVSPMGMLGDSGPDAAGYRWTDSDAVGGLPFEWQDIRDAGTPLDLAEDDETTEPIPLPFSFPFYDRNFESLRVSTNGFASFTHAGAPYTNAALPNAGPAAPENLIAVLWDDLDFRPVAGLARAYVLAEADRFIVSWHDVPHFGSAAASTFQLILHRDGSMDVQYLTLGERHDEATVGIQNAERNVGLQVVHATDYLRTGLRVHIEQLPAWLSVAPRSGAIPPGESDTLAVRFDALGRGDGAYDGVLQVRTNDPSRALTVVPGRMHVGATHTPPQVDLESPGMTATRHVEVSVDVPQGFSVQDLLVADARLANVRALSADEISGRVVYGFDRRAVFAGIASGVAEMDFSGYATGPGWFGAPVTLRWLPPLVATVEGAEVTVGEPVRLEWSDTEATAFDVWTSTDDGASWARILARTAAQHLEWVSEGPAGPRLFEVASYDAQGYRGSAYAGPLVVLAVPVPTQFDLTLAGANPTQDRALLRLSVPSRTPASVRVFDVRGGLVRTLHDGVLEAGRYTFEWDGHAASGRRSEPGVYFVQARSGIGTRTRRIVLIH